MNVRLFHTCASDLDEFWLGTHLIDGGATGVTHGSTHTAHQLVNHVAQWTFNRDTTFNTFWYQLVYAAFLVLEVTVGRTLSLAHSAQRAHATVRLVSTALVQLNFTRGLIGTRQHGTNHDHGSTGNQRFGDVAREANTAVSNNRYAVFFHRCSNVGDSTDLRHTNTGNDTGSTDGTWANAHLHAVGASFSQSNSSFSSRDVAADYLNVWVLGFYLTNTVDNTGAVSVGGMAVRGIYHDHVNTSSNQSVYTLVSASTSTNSSANQQAALVVFGSVRESLGLVDVLNGHQTNQLVGFVQNQNLFNTVLVQQTLNFVRAGAFLNGNQSVFASHHGGNRRAQVLFETNVTGGNDTDQLTAINHWHTRNAVQLLQRQNVADGVVAGNSDRVFNNAALEFLDLANFRSLLFCGQVFVDDTQTAFLSDGNGQTCFSNGVHGSGNQRDVELNSTGQTGFQRYLIGQDFGITGDQQHVIKCECFLSDSQHREPSRVGSGGSTGLNVGGRSAPKAGLFCRGCHVNVWSTPDNFRRVIVLKMPFRVNGQHCVISINSNVLARTASEAKPPMCGPVVSCQQAVVPMAFSKSRP